jgi:hypothetical protein
MPLFKKARRPIPPKTVSIAYSPYIDTGERRKPMPERIPAPHELFSQPGQSHGRAGLSMLKLYIY